MLLCVYFQFFYDKKFRYFVCVNVILHRMTFEWPFVKNRKNRGCIVGPRTDPSGFSCNNSFVFEGHPNKLHRRHIFPHKKIM